MRDGFVTATVRASAIGSAPIDDRSDHADLMPHSTLSPVFAVLRAGVHALVIATTVVVLVRALATPTPTSRATVALCILLLGTYLAGIAAARAGPRPRSHVLAWLATLVGSWLLLLATTPDAVYVAFGLFFVELHVLGSWGVPAVLATTIVAIVGFGLHAGWSAAVVIGPLLGAGVALLVAWGYRVLAREAAERERLVADLLRTQGRLAETEREAGMLAERARLAREIHDTVAQGLASIQLLLHAAERADPTGPGVGHVRMARETAATSLAETRRFIRELAPPALEGQGVVAALRRLAATEWRTAGLDVRVVASDALDLPMEVQAAILRISQGAVANVVQHADASTVTIELRRSDDDILLSVTDDGRGFDTRAIEVERAEGTSDSFGLRAIAERAAQLGGSSHVEARPGHGTTIRVTLPGGPGTVTP